jgi:hypothetical protein
MWLDDFVVSVSRDFVWACITPLLVLPGTDRYHPTVTGHEIAEFARAGRVIEPLNDSPDHALSAAAAVRKFLPTHSPRPTE